MNKLTITQQEKVDTEEQRIAAAVAERDAKQAQQLREEEEKKAAMLEAITAHRELMVSRSDTAPKTYSPLSHLCEVVTYGLKCGFT